MNSPHTLSAQDALQAQHSRDTGLHASEIEQRLLQYGENRLPAPPHKAFLTLFIQQFLSPLIYVLLLAAVLSAVAGEWLECWFILGVLLVNATIGAIQERSAEQSAASLKSMITPNARVMRDAEIFVVNSDQLVPGDLVLLESGDKVPADVRLLEAFNLSVDESMLSGESLPEQKNADVLLDETTDLSDRVNMAYSGTLVVSGRAMGVVTATALQTELGHIALDVMASEHAKPPLLQRMESFTFRLTVVMGFATVLFALVTLYQGMHWFEVFMLATALAVSAIPEGLPVAMSVALSVSIRRMAKRHVIARRLVTVEALGSCTFIASDKTGTLTRNEILVQRIALPQLPVFDLPHTALLELSQHQTMLDTLPAAVIPELKRLAQSMMLSNEGFLGERNGEWVRHGDSMDIALLVLAHNLGISRGQVVLDYPELATIPYESSARFSASLHGQINEQFVCVKGALETLLPMCSRMQTLQGDVPIQSDAILQQAHELASQGYRVLAAATGVIKTHHPGRLEDDDLQNLVFLGLTGMKDPLRDESFTAVQQCHQAGIEVVMVTGDHPVTAYAIGRELNLLSSFEQVVTSHQFTENMQDVVKREQMLRQARVYARMEPHQKLALVTALQQQGHFVAVTGDGANDAPALRVAHVGVAMGKKGTDVARETADIILTDDNFSSIVAGIEEGRVAYSNVRKVIYLLISTGFSELVLFFLSLVLGLPIPLTALQLLWLNIVTNGLQHVGLAFEPPEGHELTQPPRAPGEPIFNRVMMERVLISSLWIGVMAMLLYGMLLQTGATTEAARNATLLLMVLFENMQVFNARSETQSVFSHDIFRNRFLLFAVLGAQSLHIAAMYTPGLSEILQIAPVSLQDWALYLMLALSLLLVSEIYKWIQSQRVSIP